MIESLRFPVLTLSQGAVIVHFEPATLLVATKGALRKGYFDEMWLVDAGAVTHTVRSYETVNEPFWRRPKTPFGRGIRLRNVVLERLAPVSVEELKKRIVTAIEENSQLYEGIQEVGELVKAVSQASSVFELIRVFAPEVSS